MYRSEHLCGTGDPAFPTTQANAFEFPHAPHLSRRISSVSSSCSRPIEHAVPRQESL